MLDARADRNVARMAILAIRRAASWAHLALALLIGAGVFVQVYLIGAYILAPARWRSTRTGLSASRSTASRS
jgi:hypothetical protein